MTGVVGLLGHEIVVLVSLLHLFFEGRTCLVFFF